MKDVETISFESNIESPQINGLSGLFYLMHILSILSEKVRFKMTEILATIDHSIHKDYTSSMLNGR